MRLSLHCQKNARVFPVDHLRVYRVPQTKFYTDQMFVFVRMQLRNHVDTQPVKSVPSVERAMRYIHGIKFGMLQVREN